MAVLKVKINTKYTKKGESEPRYPIVINISHRSKRTNIEVGYNVSKKLWNEEKQQIKRGFENAAHANAVIAKKFAIAMSVISASKRELKNMNAFQLAELIEKEISVAMTSKVSKKRQEITSTTFADYSKKIENRMRKSKRNGYADVFRDARRMILNYHGNEGLKLKEITVPFLQELEAYWISIGNEYGGLSVHLRNIRNVINQAIKDPETELTNDDYPFGIRGYSITNGKSKKRAMPVEMIDKLRRYPYEFESPFWHHRNIFLFMYNMRGMNYSDVADVRLKDVNNGRLKYDRNKTIRGANVKSFNIRISDEAATILEYYSQSKNKSDLLFPIMEDYDGLQGTEGYHNYYKNKLTNFNRQLEKMSKHIGYDKKITTYVARHSFAMASVKKGLSKTQIGELLGHASALYTEAYLDEWDKEELDALADKVLSDGA